VNILPKDVTHVRSSDQAGNRTRYLRVASPARYPVDHCASLLTSFVYLFPFKSYSTFSSRLEIPIGAEILGGFWEF
jgi:hypothetical protein